MLPEVRVHALATIEKLSLATPTREGNELYLGLVNALTAAPPFEDVTPQISLLRGEVAELKKHVGVIMRDRAYLSVAKELA